ncbi:MAG TPA: hypothetical protein VGP90_08495, partial [Acidimicrobiia bacterium]|nr:hypothetical protein [Acidimicrobiia bacterium]
MGRLQRRWLVAMATVAVVLAGAAPGRADDDREVRTEWALAQVRAPEAWARTTGAGVRIGVVDTGVDFADEDLAGKIVA